MAIVGTKEIQPGNEVGLPPNGFLLQHLAGIDLVFSGHVAGEVENGLTRGLVLEDAGTGLGQLAVDEAAKVFGCLPAGIVPLVLPVRNPGIVTTAGGQVLAATQEYNPTEFVHLTPVHPLPGAESCARPNPFHLKRRPWECI